MVKCLTVFHGTIEEDEAGQVVLQDDTPPRLSARFRKRIVCPLLRKASYVINIDVRTHARSQKWLLGRFYEYE
jgi:hypothetical protein